VGETRDQVKSGAIGKEGFAQRLGHRNSQNRCVSQERVLERGGRKAKKKKKPTKKKKKGNDKDWGGGHGSAANLGDGSAHLEMLKSSKNFLDR